MNTTKESASLQLQSTEGVCPAPVNFYAGLFKKHFRPSFIFSFCCFIVLFAGSLFLSPKYKASTSLVVKSEKISNEWDILRSETESTDFEEQITSRTVLEPVLRELKLYPAAETGLFQIPEKFQFWKWGLSKNHSELSELGEAIDTFRKKVRAERLKHSAILKITAKAKSPEKAADYANTLAKSYVKYVKGQKINQIRNIDKAIDLEIKATGKSLETQGEIRKKFLLDRGWDDFSSDLQHGKAQVAALKNSLRFLNSYEEIKTTSPGTLPGSDELGLGIGNDPSLDILNRQLNRADSQLSNVSSRHSGESLGVLQARFEREWIDSIFKRQITNLKQRRERLQKQLSLEQKRLQTLMTWEPKARTIEADLLHLENRYQELLKQKSTTEFNLLVLEQSPEDVFEQLQILDHAIPPLPKNILIFKLGLAVLAFVIGVGSFFIAPLLFELLDFPSAALAPAPAVAAAAVTAPDPAVAGPVKISAPADKRNLYGYGIPSEKEGEYTHAST